MSETDDATSVRVDFYLLQDKSKLTPDHVTCKLAEKIYKSGERAHIHTSNSQQAAKIDALLWTFRQGSFVPHEIVSDASTQQAVAPITIGWHESMPQGTDIVLNLGEKIPSFYNHCQRITEVVAANDQAKKTGRARYREYKNHHCQMAQHDIS